MTATKWGLLPVLSPLGHLTLVSEADAPPLPPEVSERLQEAFTHGAGHGLWALGAGEVGTELPAVLGYWRSLGALFVTAVCAQADTPQDARRPVPPPPATALSALAAAAPPMTGAEYVTREVLTALWGAIDAAFATERSRSNGSLQDLLNRWNPAWNVVGRVHFNLAENRRDEQAPFAFLATYTTRLSAHGQGAAPAPRRSAARVRGRGPTARATALAAPPRSARVRTMRLARAMVDRARSSIRCAGRPRRPSACSGHPGAGGVGVVVRMPGSWRGSVRPARR